MKKLALVTLTVLAVVIGALALWEMREAVQLLILALALAAGLAPDVQKLTQRGMSLGRAVALSFGVLILIAIATVAVLGALAYTELALAVADVPAWYEATRAALLIRGGWVGSIGSSLPSIPSLTGSLADDSAGLGAFVVSVGGGVVSLAVLAFSVTSLGFYWLVDQNHIERLWLSLLPPQARAMARVLWEKLYREVGIFVRGESTMFLLTVVALISVYSIANLPGSITLALVGGLAQVLPLIGPPLALVPGLLVALTQGPNTAALALALGVAVLSIIKLVLAPRIFRGGVNINPVLLVVVIMVLADVLGVYVILLGPPLTAAIQVAARVLAASRQQTPSPTEQSPVALLRDQLAAIELRATPDDPAWRQVQGLLRRASAIVDSAAATIDSSTSDGTPAT